MSTEDIKTNLSDARMRLVEAEATLRLMEFSEGRDDAATLEAAATGVGRLINDVTEARSRLETDIGSEVQS